MKYLITESQQIQTFQKILNISLSLLQEKCDEQRELGAEAREIINFDACDELGTTDSIKVIDVKIDKGFIILFLDFYTESIHQYQSVDNLIWELQYQIQSYVGKNTVKLVHNDTIHNKTNSNW
jgi:hypothetical protein